MESEAGPIKFILMNPYFSFTSNKETFYQLTSNILTEILLQRVIQGEKLGLAQNNSRAKCTCITVHVLLWAHACAYVQYINSIH